MLQADLISKSCMEKATFRCYAVVKMGVTRGNHGGNHSLRILEGKILLGFILGVSEGTFLLQGLSLSKLYRIFF